MGPTREMFNMSSVVCEQQRPRPACSSMQTGQRLYYLLIGKYHILTCYEQNSSFLASLCSRGDLFESHIIRGRGFWWCFVCSFFSNHQHISQRAAHFSLLPWPYVQLLRVDCHHPCKWNLIIYHSKLRSEIVWHRFFAVLAFIRHLRSYIAVRKLLV